MAEILAAVFEGAATAARVLERLRAEARELGLEEACALRREADGRLHLEEAVDPPRRRRLPHGFWQRLAGHLFARTQDGAEGAARCFGRPFCEAVAEAVGPDRSAIFVHLEGAASEALLRALETRGARILRAPAAAAAGELVERLEAALVEVPPAEALARTAEAVETERLLEAHARRRAEEEARRQELERLRAETLPAAEIDAILRRCAEAARRGARRATVLTFPAELLDDRGRRILQGEPDWPATLEGRPRAFHRFFVERLAPLGYRLEAEVSAFEDGVPARFALVLDWSGAGGRAGSQQAQETGGGGQIAPQHG
jgi:uncharacterized membrane protein